ncbi:MAG: response regulator [Anaerolineae bacterium]|nr:response regulator [Anaerolineae bacterium]
MSGKRILYIEDNFDNRILIKRVLEAEGFTVIEAENGTKGLELALSTHPDLVLMDINLPDIDGYECTDRLRKATGGAHVPIVALTANAMEGDIKKAMDAGCNGYIPKPIDVDNLPKQIEKHLRKDGQTPQPASSSTSLDTQPAGPQSPIAQPASPPTPGAQPASPPGSGVQPAGSPTPGAQPASPPESGIQSAGSPSPIVQPIQAPNVPGRPADPPTPGLQPTETQEKSSQPQDAQSQGSQVSPTHNQGSQTQNPESTKN